MIETMTTVMAVWFVVLLLGVPLYVTMGLAAFAFVGGGEIDDVE